MFLSLSHGSGEAYSGKIWGERYWNPLNKFGFRDEEPKNGKNNVFFVGDSFTAGWGIKKIEDRFSEITAKELKKTGKIINEINLGRYGADTQLEFQIFNKFIQKSKISPNHIVLQYFVNDMDNFIEADDQVIKQKLKVEYQREKVSYLENVVKIINNRQWNIRSIIDWAKFTNGQ
jgi:lysophospholipase L1-like esterase